MLLYDNLTKANQFYKLNLKNISNQFRTQKYNIILFSPSISIARRDTIASILPDVAYNNLHEATIIKINSSYLIIIANT